MKSAFLSGSEASFLAPVRSMVDRSLSDKLSRMPLTKVETDICQFVVHRLLDENELTRRQVLLKEFKGSLLDALRKLVDCAVLRPIEQTYGNETYLPRAIAFHFCGDPAPLAFAKNSTEIVLQVLLVLYEQELDKEPQDQRQLTPTDVEAEARKLKFDVDEKLIRIGLYFADELSVFHLSQKDPKQIFPVSFKPGERIYEVMKDISPWDSLIKRGRVSVENHPYGRSLNSIDISEHPQDIADLPNKEKLIADVGSFLTRRAGIALLVIDLDNFKSVNDTKGHQEGDACLDRVVKAIGNVLGRKGILYRWGGDEFAVSLPDFSTEEAHATAERIRVAVEQAKPGTDVRVTTSIGVTGNEQINNGSAEDLLTAADKAMYTSKEQGKNRVTSWSLANAEEQLSQNPAQNESQIGPQSISARVGVPPNRKAELRIHAFEQSCFTLVTNSQNRGQLVGMHVTLDMALENLGNKGTTIQRYDLYIRESDKTYQNIRPNLGLIDIQGRHCVRNIGNEPKITTDGLIRVQAETMSPRGFLPFFPLDAPILTTGPVHCRLTVTDTGGNSMSQDFELREV